MGDNEIRKPVSLTDSTAFAANKGWLENNANVSKNSGEYAKKIEIMMEIAKERGKKNTVETLGRALSSIDMDKQKILAKQQYTMCCGIVK